jgi:pyridoxamine 5'-phosphate oxidase-like protein
LGAKTSEGAAADARSPRPETTGESWIDELSPEECLFLLRASKVGRIALIVDEFPVVLPVNHRLIDKAGGSALLLRTRSGSVIDRASTAVAFQVDGLEPARREGWSVLVRGRLQYVDPDTAEICEGLGLDTWLDGRDTWLVIEPIAITGRRLHAAAQDWSKLSDESRWLLEMSDELRFASPKAQRRILREYYSR